MIQRIGRNGAIFLTLIAFLAIWWGVVVVGDIQPYVLPTPGQVIEVTFTRWADLAPACWFTVQRALLGLAISIVIGIPTALLLDFSERLHRMFYPLLVASQVVPVAVFAPILFLWFGFSSIPEVTVVVVMCAFPIVAETLSGLAQTDRNRLQLAQTMGGGVWKTFTKVKVPGALPSIFNGLKIAVTLSLVGALVAEFVSSSQGLGSLLLKATDRLDNPLLFAGALYASIVGIALFAFVEFIERLVIPWHVSQRLA